MKISINIADREVTYLLRALKERQKNAKGKQERLSLAGLRDLVEVQTGRRDMNEPGRHYVQEWEKQQREKKKRRTTP